MYQHPKNVIDATIEFCQKNLSIEAKQYFLSRGWTEETIKQWKLGFFPQDKKIDLYSIISKLGLNKSDLEEYLIMNSYGNSVFLNRVIFPIYDLHGKAIAITGRTLTNAKPKYINNKYDKGKLLYGLNFAFEEIRKNDRVFLFEGNADVITAHQFSLKESVGCQGTAFTQEHYILLSRYTKNIFQVFDGDAGGLSAINSTNKKNLDHIDKSHILNLNEKEVNLYKITLEKAKDPDEFLFKFGKEKFLEDVYKQSNNKGLQVERRKVKETKIK